MGLVLKDRIKETTTTTGTGTLTLAGAATNFRSFADIGDGNICYYCIEDTTNNVWEVGLGTYTASGTTLARTEVYNNSSGTTSALNLSAGTKNVYVTFPGNIAANGFTKIATQTAAYTALANELIPVSANGASADFAISLKASPKDGDRIAILMVAEHATRKVTVSLNGGSFAGTIGYFDLILDGDYVVFQYNSTLAKWFVEVDKIQRHVVDIYRSAAQTFSSSTWTKVAFDSENYDVGGIGDYTTNDRVDIRRNGKYRFSTYGYLAQASVYAEQHFQSIKVNGSFVSHANYATHPSYPYVGSTGIALPFTKILSVSDYVEFFILQVSSSGYSQNFSNLHLFVEELKP